ncbi:MAG: hypothetical protein QOH93_2779 [Chloroflexia bacterium]|nr:hypothetical protein [Chloroflexia bacterium]
MSCTLVLLLRTKQSLTLAGTWCLGGSVSYEVVAGDIGLPHLKQKRASPGSCAPQFMQ